MAIKEILAAIEKAYDQLDHMKIETKYQCSDGKCVLQSLDLRIDTLKTPDKKM